MIPITIIGGGIAGLSLGIALVREGIPVTVNEAGHYPRHRVCGEFINGVSPSTLQRLDIYRHLSGSVANQSTGWFRRDRKIRRFTLTSPAIGLSRYRLDHRMADHFTHLGGCLLTGKRLSRQSESPALVRATGRRPAKSRWLGLKMHLLNCPMEDDLQMHLGENAYVGLSRIEDGKVNVCGLFRRQPGNQSPKSEILFHYLKTSGLKALEEQIRNATPITDSITATAGFDFHKRRPKPGEICLGDAYAAIPPFSGNGMSMALESAEVACDPLLGYSRGDRSWERACADTKRAMIQRFRTSLITAHLIHPFLTSPTSQSLLGWLNRRGLLPMDSLFRLLR